MQTDLKFISRGRTLLFSLLAATLFCPFSASAQSPEVPEVGSEVPEVGVEYRIKARHSGQVLDVLGGSHRVNANVGTWAQLGSPAKQQKWKLIDVPGHPEHYWLAVSHSGAFLDVPGQAKNRGASIHVWNNQPTNKANQFWKLEPAGENYFRIKSADSGLYLDVLGGLTASGSDVGQWPKHPGYQQQWSFHRVDPVSPAKELIQGEIVTTPRWVRRCGPGGKCSVTIAESYTFSSGLVSAWSSEFETTLSSTLSSSLKVGVKSESPVGGASTEAELTAEISTAFRDAVTRSKSESSERKNESKSSLTCEVMLPVGKFGYFYEEVYTLGDESVISRSCLHACGTTKPTFDVGSKDHSESCQ